MKFDKSKSNGNYICPTCRRSMWTTEERVKKHLENCKGRSNANRTSKKLATVNPSDNSKEIKELEGDLKILESQKGETKEDKKRLSNQKYAIKQKIKKLKNV